VKFYLGWDGGVTKISLENSFVVKIGAKCQALYRRSLPWLPLLLGFLNFTWLVLFLCYHGYHIY